MKVQLKYGHHNGDRFYHAGEILECSKALYASLIKQGLAVPAAESKADKKQEQTQAAHVSESFVQETAKDEEQPAETKEQEKPSEQPKENAVQEAGKEAEGDTSETAETSKNYVEKTKAK